MVDTVAENRRTRNVIAERPGHPRRVAMVGAHLDSVARARASTTTAAASRSRSRWPSGCAAQQGLRFGFWGAEELGLYGSRRYVAR